MGRVLAAVLVGTLMLTACGGGASPVTTTRPPTLSELTFIVEHGLQPAVRVQGRPSYALADRMSFYDVPGAMISVIEDGGVQWTNTYGLLRPEPAAATLWAGPVELGTLVSDWGEAAQGDWDSVRHSLDAVGLGDEARFSYVASRDELNVHVVGYADGRSAAVVVTDGQNGPALAEEILGGVALAYRWPGYLPEEIVPATIDHGIYDDYVGEYELEEDNPAGFDRVFVWRDEDRLFARLGDVTEVELIPLSTRRFLPVEAPGGVLVQTPPLGLEVSFVILKGETWGLIIHLAEDEEVSARLL